MDYKDLLNFNYPVNNQNMVEYEKTIKQINRDNALNIVEDMEIKKYTDGIHEKRAYDTIIHSLDVELLSQELQQMFGSNPINSMDLDNDGFVFIEDDSTNSKTIDEANSSDDDNDYHENYFNDDDIEEKNEEAF